MQRPPQRGRHLHDWQPVEIAQRERGLRPVTCNTYIAAINAFCRWLHEEHDIHEPLGEIDSTPDHAEFLATWQVAQAAYQEGRFEVALASFRAAASLRSDDGPSCVFIERCAAFLKEGTPQGWDGTWHFDRK